MSQDGAVRLTVNGEARKIPAGCTAAGLLGLLGVEQSSVAVAVGGVVVRRADLGDTALREGDVVEIVRAVGGG